MYFYYCTHGCVCQLDIKENDDDEDALNLAVAWSILSRMIATTVCVKMKLPTMMTNVENIRAATTNPASSSSSSMFVQPSAYASAAHTRIRNPHISSLQEAKLRNFGMYDGCKRKGSVGRDKRRRMCLSVSKCLGSFIHFIHFFIENVTERTFNTTI